MFYIKHNSDNFTIIDCHLSDENKENIVEDIRHAHLGKGVTRFISTHPDEDHFKGIQYLDNNIDILNFYCVKNAAIKLDDSKEFDYYCQLRDSDKVFNISRGCARKWMNQGDEERGSSGISMEWPIMDNPHFIEALRMAERGESPNNISAVIKYGVNDGVTMLWMGDMETDFMEKIVDAIPWPKVDILFAPHHGRDSGRVPHKILDKLKPRIIVLGEAPSRHLNYYGGYHTITQNSAGDIIFECSGKDVDIFVSNYDYDVDFLEYEARYMEKMNYLGTLKV